MKKGIWYAVGAYVFWGLFPIYWKMLAGIPALQLLGHRIVWSFLLLTGVLLLLRQGMEFRRALSWRTLLIFFIAAILIGVNWLTYVWAIGAGFIVETSLGYFINPLLSVLMGVIFLRERLRPLQWIPVGMAAAGVLYLTFAYGALPWIALTLAFTFGLYGLVKKTAPLGSFHGLTLETGILFLPALGFLLYSEFSGSAAFLHSAPPTDLMLFGAGAVTVIPLLLFASAARRIPLTTMGVLQYINPTMQFLLGVLVYREPFNQHRLIGFAVVWAALILYGVEGLVARRRARRG
ncbi:MAG: chloramphenicol-sensitive protein RarD [Anaerolineaceae bacterium]|nr:MAG: chloramphenicol-sensitive protein RarD [Anaerolineaceae bacterium]